MAWSRSTPSSSATRWSRDSPRPTSRMRAVARMSSPTASRNPSRISVRTRTVRLASAAASRGASRGAAAGASCSASRSATAAMSEIWARARSTTWSVSGVSSRTWSFFPGMRPALRSSTDGVERATTPSAASFFTTRNPRTAGTGQLPAISTSTRTRRVAPRWGSAAGSAGGRTSGADATGAGAGAAAGAGAGPAAGGEPASEPRSPSRSRRVASASFSIAGPSTPWTSPREAPCTISWSRSPAPRRRSTAFASRRDGSLRKTSTRSSARWARAAMPSSSIDALIPFTLWAWRKQESMASLAPSPAPWRAASSSRTRSLAKAWRWSPASAT